jgi:hypothetical protein
MSHICANDEYRSQVGATNRPENIIRYVSFVSLPSILKVVDVFSFHLQNFAFAQIFPRSQPMREYSTSNCILPCLLEITKANYFINMSSFIQLENLWKKQNIFQFFQHHKETSMGNSLSDLAYSVYSLQRINFTNTD